MKKNLYQKINEIMKEVESVEKGVTITMPNGRSYSGTSHDDITRLLHGPVANHGIVLSPSVVDSRLETMIKEKEYNGKVQKSYEYIAHVMVELTAINSDAPEEKITVRMPAFAIDSGDKAYGKAISMATKYCYLKLFMLESVDEEEARPEARYEVKKSYSAEAQLKEKQLNKIKEELTKKTVGLDATQKTEFLAKKLRVSSYKDIEKMNNNELVNLYEQLTKVIK